MIFCLDQSRSVWPDPKVCTVQKLSGGVLMESLCSTEVLVSLFPLITKETLFILLSFYAPYSDILASAETLAPQHKDWVTLSAGSGYRLFFSDRACTALTGTKHPHTKTHILTTASPSASPNAVLYQGCQMLPAWPYPPSKPPPPLQQSAIRAASCQPSFWYLYFHRILITLCLGFLRLLILLRLFSLRSCVFSAMWIQGADLLYFFDAHISFWVVKISLQKRENEKQCHIDRLLSHILSFFPADEVLTPFMAVVHLFIQPFPI